MEEIQWKIKLKLNMIALVLATAGTLCFPQILNLKESSLGFTNSIFSVFVWLLCFYAVKISLETIDLQDKRAWLIAVILSFLFTAAMLFGVRLDSVENVNFKDISLWVSLPVLTCLFTVLVRKFWNFLGGMEEKRAVLMAQNLTVQTPQMKERTANLLTFLFLLLCWLPVLLAVYPGFFVYDAQDEYLQVASRTFSTHHPLVHVLLLGGIICAVHKVTDSYNLGIACYTVFQMILVSGGFTFLLSYLRKKKVSKTLRFISMLYFGLFPVIVMFTLCSAKDALFSTALLLLLICLLEMNLDSDSFFTSKGWLLLIGASATSMMLLRNNGLYAFVFLIPFLAFYQKKYRKRVLIWAAISIAGCLLINGGFRVAFQADDSENQEILTVPIQQLARTYKYEPEVFSEEDVKTLHEILPEEALVMYNARLSDPVKYRFRNDAFAAGKVKYIKLWAKIGLKKPLSYINAWLMTSYGFWYPDTVINVYAGNSVFTFTYEDSSYFGYEVELPGVRDSKIPWLDEVYRRLSLEIEQEKVPIVSMLFSPGGLFWLFAFVFSYMLYRKNYHILMPCIMVLAVWLTVILGPTYLPRYVLIFWFGLPLLVALLLEEERFRTCLTGQ
ncbi:MAG: DUF6020 family protein [Lachnospiraceae bacterium]|nr:DUF6020 family protein [Lachnospiraceae bacterium]